MESVTYHDPEVRAKIDWDKCEVTPSLGPLKDLYFVQDHSQDLILISGSKEDCDYWLKCAKQMHSTGASEQSVLNETWQLGHADRGLGHSSWAVMTTKDKIVVETRDNELLALHIVELHNESLTP